MNQYRVVITWQIPLGLGRCTWKGTVNAENVDAAIRKAKQSAGAPERATSETQRIDTP